jgi:hypothetical protein
MKASDFMSELAPTLGPLARIEPHPVDGTPSVLIDGYRGSARIFVERIGRRLHIEGCDDGSLSGRDERRRYEERLLMALIGRDQEQFDLD